MPDGERMSQPIVFVTPIAPSDRDNGLAMRAGMLLEALAEAAPVELVIVPVAGPSASEWAATRARRVTVVEPIGAADVDRHVRLQMADRNLRARLEATAPLPYRVRLAPPTLAAEVAGTLGAPARRPAAVVALREYLAPLGIALGQQLNAARVVIDLDDDAETLLTAMGESVDAAAFGRLARAWLSSADVVSVASPIEAGTVATRYGLSTVETIANTVRAPSVTSTPPGHDRLLFVGNLTYGPNIDAVRMLVDEVLPLVRRERPDATIDLVGPGDSRLSAMADRTGVSMAGQVPDVAPWYDRADIVVVPMRFASGTRIKVLEAFAHHRPVVATAAAVSGLAVREGVDVLVAESADAIARGVVELLAQPDRAAELARAAAATFGAHYAPDAIARHIRHMVLGDQYHERVP